MVDTRARRTPVGDIPADRKPVADNRAGHRRVAHSPAVDIRAVDNRQAALAARMPVDQAIRAAVRVVRQVVPSPDNAPHVVAHTPILSSAEPFLNVPPIPGA
ncbi:hypothetical protein CG716_11580 [Mycolicibacterium sphagni]|uniref:Uncharacterized protein n=1 Tax=Mycolicibacterium sphagni TaxID=1786 RepID=A0A255DLK5_9MYCO|nr:hypothetical protein CG716_11580 [Mycolicibacterium sphagni]